MLSFRHLPVLSLEDVTANFEQIIQGMLDERYVQLSTLPLVWKTLTLTAPWENASAELYGAEYSKDVNGIVRLRGAVKNTEAYTYGGTNRQIGTLPEKYRPGKTVIQAGLQRDTAAHSAVVQMAITAAGVVTIDEYDWANTGGNNGSVILFVLDQLWFAT